jgi:hypothetical protein
VCAGTEHATGGDSRALFPMMMIVRIGGTHEPFSLEREEGSRAIVKQTS